MLPRQTVRLPAPTRARAQAGEGTLSDFGLASARISPMHDAPVSDDAAKQAWPGGMQRHRSSCVHVRSPRSLCFWFPFSPYLENRSDRFSKSARVHAHISGAIGGWKPNNAILATSVPRHVKPKCGELLAAYIHKCGGMFSFQFLCAQTHTGFGFQKPIWLGAPRSHRPRPGLGDR